MKNIDWKKEFSYRKYSSGTGINWGEIGYDKTPDDITEAFEHAKDISNNWDPNVESMVSAFYNDKKIVYFPKIDTSKVTNMNSTFSNCFRLKLVPQLDTSKVTTMSGIFFECHSLKVFPQLDTSNVVNAYRMIYNTPIEDYPSLDFSKVEKFDNESLRGYSSRGSITYKGFINYGKAFNKTETNYSYYKMNLAYYDTDIDHDSLMNVINNLYDLNLSYNVANGGTLYTQSLELGKDKSGNTNISKLTDEEIAIATSKGWTLI